MMAATNSFPAVMAGLVPAIHDLPAGWKKDVDARDKPGHDDLRIMRLLSYTLRAVLIALPAAIVCFLASAEPAYADLKICNRMSYVVEVAIGIDEKAATATRGWFRIDPAACRVVAQGTLTADRILLNARARSASTAPRRFRKTAATRCALRRTIS